ncbi:hypothetical protein M422DRAFT_25091 [Sphaerobolus stellatus SS14]|nr:hypothetical protein M422DRAFT_25091 [Sphaerobolus stellatus SS14]
MVFAFSRCIPTSSLRLPKASTTFLARRYATSSKAIHSPRYRWIKGFGFVIVTGIGVYTWDREFNASSLLRNARTLYTCAIIAADYKINFKPGQGEKIMEIHERVAERIYNLFVKNGGLYIKIGQALAANTAMLPAPFHTRFSKLFDDAPQVPYSDVEKVFVSEFGTLPIGKDGIFEEFEERAVASASIAQVHRAKLKKEDPSEPDTWVAVKIQKPAVSKQVDWDLAAYRLVMWMYENWVFDMPVYFLVDFISEHMRLELDFLNEARNAKRTAALVASEPQLSGRVYIPKVYDQYTTGKVMTAEYIDGVKLSNRRAIQRLLDGGRHESDNTLDPSLLPNWDGSSDPSYSSRPLKGGAAAIMDTLVSLFSVQIFQWGFVHCDPHPGNIIIRRKTPSNEPQLVLIDHGLYVRMPEDLRRDYAMLWKSLLNGDLSEVRKVATEWGIGGESVDLLAGGVLLGPWRTKPRSPNVERRKLDPYEASLKMKEKLRKFLENTERFPKALVFLARNMRMVQGNNQALGSPVNRVKIIGQWASRSLATAPYLSLSQRMLGYWHHMTYVIVMFSIDVLFWVSKVKQWVRHGRSASFEDELEQEMRRFSKELGIELGDNAFLG